MQHVALDAIAHSVGTVNDLKHWDSLAKSNTRRVDSVWLFTWSWSLQPMKWQNSDSSITLISEVGWEVARPADCSHSYGSSFQVRHNHPLPLFVYNRPILSCYNLMMSNIRQKHVLHLCRIRISRLAYGCLGAKEWFWPPFYEPFVNLVQ